MLSQNELSKILNINKSSIYKIIYEPKDIKNGDFALPCYKISSLTALKSPAEIACYIRKKVKIDGIGFVDNVGPYVNFYINTKILASYIISNSIFELSTYENSKKAIIVTLSFIGRRLDKSEFYKMFISNFYCNILKIQQNDVKIICYTNVFFDITKVIFEFYHEYGLMPLSIKDYDEIICLYSHFKHNYNNDIHFRNKYISTLKDSKYYFGYDMQKAFDNIYSISVLYLKECIKIMNLKIDYFDNDIIDYCLKEDIMDKIKSNGICDDYLDSLIVPLDYMNQTPLILKNHDVISQSFMDIVYINKIAPKYSDIYYVSSSLKNNNYKKVNMVLKLITHNDFKSSYINSNTSNLCKINDKTAISFIEQFFNANLSHKKVSALKWVLSVYHSGTSLIRSSDYNKLGGIDTFFDDSSRHRYILKKYKIILNEVKENYNISLIYDYIVECAAFLDECIKSYDSSEFEYVFIKALLIIIRNCLFLVCVEV